ncbi:imm11 family protein [Sphingomonas sp.]|uniref:imm11 family protein n=1 Tax=Sphingomonas sp. TaxID=28214 RepID=UPI003D6D0D39
MPDYIDDIPPHIDPSMPPKLVFNRSQIGSSHIWRDKHIDIGGPFIFDDFAAALRSSDLTGLGLSDIGLKTI